VETHWIFHFVQHLWRNYICIVFQPLFFTISGYLFFIGFNGARNEFFKKYKSRFKSLVIPYLFWNIACLLQMFALKYNPVTGSLINSDYSGLLTSGIRSWLYHLFIEPAGFHLWFLRDLILIVCFTPIIWFLNKYVWYLFIPILIIGDLCGLPYIGSFVPFALGALFAIKKVNIEKKISGYIVLIIGLIFVLLAILHEIFLPEASKFTFYLAQVLFLFIWFGYDTVYKKGITFDFLKMVAPYTFFIYVFHEPSINIFKRTILMIGKNSEISWWFCYFFSPILVIFLSILIAKLMQKYCNNFYKVITGGR
jgi:surface polysaccharide O-acyltransferase-like enzyme